MAHQKRLSSQSDFISRELVDYLDNKKMKDYLVDFQERASPERVALVTGALQDLEVYASLYKDSKKSAEEVAKTFEEALPHLGFMTFIMDMAGHVPDNVAKALDKFIVSRTDLKELRGLIEECKKVDKPNQSFRMGPFFAVMDQALSFVEDTQKQNRPKQWKSDISPGASKAALMPQEDPFRAKVLELLDNLRAHDEELKFFPRNLNPDERVEMETRYLASLKNVSRACADWLALPEDKALAGRAVLNEQIIEGEHAMGRVLAMAARKHDMPDLLTSSIKLYLENPDSWSSLQSMMYMQAKAEPTQLTMNWQPVADIVNQMLTIDHIQSKRGRA